MQNRIGPARAGGRFGILQSLADGIKLFFKEDLLPDRADKRVFRLAPYLSAVPAFLSFAIVPDRRRGHDRRTTRPTCSSPTRRSASCSCSP